MFVNIFPEGLLTGSLLVTSLVAFALSAGCPQDLSAAGKGSFSCRDPDVIGSRDLGIGNLRQNIHALQTGLFLRCRQENQIVLIVEILLEPFQVRLKADQTRRAKRVAFSSGFISNLG